MRSIQLALCTSLLLVSACGDDEKATDTSQADTSQPADTTPDATETAETTPGGACDPNPCTAGKPAACSADSSAVETYATTGTCSDNGGTASCDYPVAGSTPCGDGVCSGGACVSSVAACGYAFSDDVSYITELRLGSTADDGTDKCCFDFDGDGEVDNKIGDLVKLVMGFPQVTADVNNVIADNIASGKFTLLMEAVGLDQLPSDGEVDLKLFYGTDTDTDAANNVAGNGTFTADLFSFADGTATPVTSFDNAVISNGNLFAGPSVFRLTIPLQNGLVINGDIKNARLEGKLSAGPNGGLAVAGDGFGAKLGGVFHQDQLFGALNNFVASTCSCLDTAGSTVIEKDAGGAWTCNPEVDSSGCDNSEGSDEAPCVTLANICGAALLLVQPDIDAEGFDGVPESLSIGIWLKGTGGKITGVAPDVCQ